MMGGGPLGNCLVGCGLFVYFLSGFGPNLIIGPLLACRAAYLNNKYGKKESVKLPLLYSIPIVGPTVALYYS